MVHARGSVDQVSVGVFVTPFGGKVGSSITSKTDYVIMEIIWGQQNWKTKQILILSENEFTILNGLEA
jgi:NAD-dependent DNA ligase